MAIHTARQGSIPLIMFVGQVPRAHRDREAFQEVDIDAMFAPLAKWTATIDDPARIPEYVSRAYRVATAGRPGPVVLSLPEDVLTESADVPDAARTDTTRAAPTPSALARVRELINGAERPLVVVGGGGWSDRAAIDAVALCESWGVPLATAFRCQDYVDNDSPVYCGTLGLGIDPRLKARVRESDLLLVIGARLDEPTTGTYEMIEAPRPRQALIHVHADPDELGRVFEPTLGICAGSAEFVAAAQTLEAPDGARFAELDRRRKRPTRARSGRRARPSTGSIWPARSRACATPSGRRRSSPTAPATTRCGSIASGAFTGSAPSSRPSAARWGTGCRPRSPPSWPNPNVRLSRSTVTAAS